MNTDPQFLSMAGTANCLSITLDQLRRRVTKGTPPAAYQFGKTIRFLEAEVDALVEAQMVKEAQSEKRRFEYHRKCFENSEHSAHNRRLASEAIAACFKRPEWPPGSLPLP